MKFHCNPQNNVLGNIMVANFRNFVESLLKCDGWGVWGLFLFFFPTKPELWHHVKTRNCENLSFNFRRQLSYSALWLQREIENMSPRARKQLGRAQNALLLNSYTL